MELVGVFETVPLQLPLGLLLGVQHAASDLRAVHRMHLDYQPCLFDTPT